MNLTTLIAYLSDINAVTPGATQVLVRDFYGDFKPIKDVQVTDYRGKSAPPNVILIDSEEIRGEDMR